MKYLLELYNKLKTPEPTYLQVLTQQFERSRLALLDAHLEEERALANRRALENQVGRLGNTLATIHEQGRK